MSEMIGNVDPIAIAKLCGVTRIIPSITVHITPSYGPANASAKQKLCHTHVFVY
jgi:hypothetical protein